MKIGISETDNNFHRYLEWLDFFKADYERLYFRHHETDLAKLNNCDALILSGGVDIYPELYCDWDTVETRGSYKPERDGFELKLLESAVQRKMPVLGICRGCQLINVFFRGSLIFDLFEIRGVHHDRISETEDRVHSVRVFPDSLLHEITGHDELTVNSAHHQSPDRIGEGLRVNCKALDGVIEGIEYNDSKAHPFLLGVMWHPERFIDFKSAGSKNIIERLIVEADKYKKSK
jgi:putative glutamine amidotransferase